MKTIVFTTDAAKDLDDLPGAIRATIEQALDSYAMTGRGDITRLKGRDGFRLRVGRYRVIFDEDAMTILAIHIGPRQTATYRRN